MKPLRSRLFFGIGLAAAAGFYACGSSSNGNSGGTPPPNEAGSDTTSSSSGAGSSSGSGSGSGGEASTDSPENGDGGTPACAELPGTVVYVEADDSQEPLLKLLARQLRDDAGVVLAFELTDSCSLTKALYAGTRIPNATPLLYVPSTKENPSWTPSDPEQTCIAASTSGTAPDLGISAVFDSSCPNVGTPGPNVGVIGGPVQTQAFVVPTAEFTNQTSITAAEAYYAFGDGANNPVTYDGAAEWNDPSQFFLRPVTSSSLVSTATTVGLTPAQMTFSSGDGGSGDGRHLLAKDSDVLAGVAASQSMQTIGLLGDGVADANRTKVSDLALAAFGQSYAFYPDSTTTSLDRQNVRDGHYVAWSPTFYITQVGQIGEPSNPSVKYLVDLILGVAGAAPPSGYLEGGVPIDGIGDVAKAGLVPGCAMQVQKAGDGQPLSPYSPATPCTCFYLSKVQGAQLPASCTTCTTPADCGDGSVGCLDGYCEMPPAAPTSGQPGCKPSDGTNAGILNACTSAAYVQKTNLVVPQSDGGLLPLNP